MLGDKFLADILDRECALFPTKVRLDREQQISPFFLSFAAGIRDTTGFNRHCRDVQVELLTQLLAFTCLHFLTSGQVGMQAMLVVRVVALVQL